MLSVYACFFNRFDSVWNVVSLAGHLGYRTVRAVSFADGRHQRVYCMGDAKNIEADPNVRRPQRIVVYSVIF